MITGKKGSAFVWIMITVMVFVVAIVYMIFTQVVIKVQGATVSVLNDSDYAKSYNTTIMVWKYWPLIALIGLIIAGILLSLKQEPYSGYDFMK